MNEELNREFESTIELPVKTMKKAASKEVRNLIFGGIAIFALAEVVRMALNAVPLYLLVLEYMSPFIIICGLFCALINLYNGSIACQKVEVQDDGIKINEDFFGFECPVTMDFAIGKFFGKTRKFNSIYLDVRASGAHRKYWLGHYFDKSSFHARDEIAKVLDFFEEEGKIARR